MISEQLAREYKEMLEEFKIPDYDESIFDPRKAL